MSEDLTPAQRVGRHVRAALAEHGMTQMQLSSLLGLTTAAIGRRVAGQVSFRADELIKIAEYLGEQPSRFFRPIPEPRARDETAELVPATGTAAA